MHTILGMVLEVLGMVLGGGPEDGPGLQEDEVRRRTQRMVLEVVLGMRMVLGEVLGMVLGFRKESWG